MDDETANTVEPTPAAGALGEATSSREPGAKVPAAKAHSSPAAGQRKREAQVDVIRIRLVRSPLGRLPVHRRTVAALGLRKIGQTVEKRADAAILGMVRQVEYLLRVERPSSGPSAPPKAVASDTGGPKAPTYDAGAKP